MDPLVIVISILVFMVVTIYLMAALTASEAEQTTEKNKNNQRKRRPSKPINWRVLLSNEIQRHLPDHKTEAIIRYRQLTGADVQDGEQTIAYHIAYPHQVPAHFRHYELTEEEIRSLHKMLRQGQRAEAHKRYQALTGVDQFAVDVGLDILEQQVLIEEEHFAALREIADADSDEIPQHIVRTQQKG